MAATENNILRLQRERNEAREQVETLRSELTELLAYFASSKFKGDGNDYAHVSTDIYPKLSALRARAF